MELSLAITRNPEQSLLNVFGIEVCIMRKLMEQKFFQRCSEMGDLVIRNPYMLFVIA